MSSRRARGARRDAAALVALLVALVLAACTAFAQEPAQEPAPAPAGPAAPALPDLDPVGPPPAGPAASTSPGDGAIPLKWLPPGALAADRGPSAAIFPPQKQTLRFNHKLHVTQESLTCKTCHFAATTSESVADHLTPQATLCDECHDTDHRDLAVVKAGSTPSGQCAFCHLGYSDGDGNRVARFEIPRANLIFNHKKHAARNINCQQCHGEVQELALATRDQLPRMRGCFGCHQQPDAAARGDAKASCETCHVKGGATSGGRLRTEFASGTLRVPRWMHNAQHGPDFLERHRSVAANDSQFCANCHKEEFCTGCHDGRVRPRSIHPSDYLNLHAVEGRLATQKCTSCHREQSFCLGCHQRLGVSMSGPARDSGRFHPPKSEWSDPPRRPGHHSFEANRNLSACVSCHIERDCVVCHGGQGIGGGFNPHPGSFAGGCATQLRRNPRPCYVCHDPGAAALQRCK